MIRLAMFTALTGALLAILWRVGVMALDTLVSPGQVSALSTVTAGWAPPAPKSQAVVDWERTTLAEFPLTPSRPVFFEGRRYPVREAPMPPPVQVVSPPPPPPPPAPIVSADKLRLRGVMADKGDQRALIEVQGQPPQWHRIGEKVQDWEIERIAPGSVHLRNGGRSATLDLYGAPPTK